MTNLKRLLSHLTLHRWRSLLAVVGTVVVGVALAQPSYGWSPFGFVKDSALFFISLVLYFLLILVMGWLATTATKVLVYTAQLTNFTDLAVIVEAWEVVRDLANMFFIVILLVIAFGTLFRLEAYSWKKLLPKMVLAAVLMNYSRAICGFIVDASQVIMLTFVAAIKDAASVGLAEAFNLSQLLQFGDADSASSLTPADTAGEAKKNGSEQRLIAIIAAGFMLATMFTVQCVYIVVLVGRLVMIWFLTVLSPLAYVSKVLPATERYASQWWEMFGRYVTVGPMCMFFLWLAMFIASKSIAAGGLGSVSASAEVVAAEVDTTNNSGAAALDTSLIAGFVIATTMLMAGMKLAQQNASELGEATGKASGFANFVTRTAPAFIAGGLAHSAADRIYQATGADLNLKRGYDRISHKRKELSTQRVQQGYSKAQSKAKEGKILASMLGAQDFAYEQYMPLVGKQGIGLDPKGLLGRRIYGNAQYQKLKPQAKAAEDALAAEEKAKAAHLATVGDKHTDVKTKQRKLEEIDNETRELGKMKSDGKQWDTGSTQVQAMLTKLINSKGKQRDDLLRKGDTAGAKNIDNQIQNMERAKNVGGKVDIDVSGGLGADLKGVKQERLDELGEDRKTWVGKETRDHKNNREMANADDLAAFMKNQGAGFDTSIGKLKAKKKAVHDEVNRYAPVVDYEGVTALEGVIATEMKKYGKDDDEETLVALLKDKIHEGKGIEALGIMRHMAAVGHDNEIPKAFEMECNVENMKKIAEQMVATGLDREAVMSTFNQMSLDSKRNNHQWFAEAITTKHGAYDWRTDEQRNYRNYVESQKRGHEPLVRGNRLAVGAYGDDGQWKPDPGMLRYLVQNMPGLRDDAYKGRLNPNLGNHIFGSEGGKVEKMIEALIKELHTDPDALAKATEAMKLWKQSIDKGTLGLDKGFSADQAVERAINNAFKRAA